MIIQGIMIRMQRLVLDIRISTCSKNTNPNSAHALNYILLSVIVSIPHVQ